MAAARQALSQGRGAAALAALQDLSPDAEVLFYRAAALRLDERPEAALAALRQAQAQAPDNPAIAINVGGLLLDLDRPAEALPHLQAAVRAAPQLATAWTNLAGVRLLLGDLPGAGEAARRALEREAGDARAQQVLAQVLTEQRRREEAVAAAERACTLAPQRPESWRVLGEAWRAAKDSERAAQAYERALALAPDDRQLAGVLLLLLQQLCRWDEAEAIAARLDAAPEGAAAPEGSTTAPDEPLLAAVARSGDAARHLAVARSWARQIERRAGPPLPPMPAAAKERLSVGYLSGDLRDHAVGHLVAGLFAAHDRRAVEVTLLDYGPPDESAVRTRIRSGADAVLELAALSHRAAAERIRAAGIDLLVDLAGHTRGNRLEIAALRPAPLQITWLGFPGTTGLAAFDYLIGDAVVTPPADAGLYDETLLVLPRPYQSNPRRPTALPTPERRADHGLPEEAVVLGAMNASYKLTRQAWDIWMRLLRQRPAALLWLFAPTEALRQRLRARATEAGVDTERLVFAGRLPHPRHLGRLALADLALDTLVYNGHTTTSDCLSMGVPVVGLKGAHFASRVTESLLRAIGLPELVAADPGGYEALALALIDDAGRRATLRRHILRERESGRLFDEADMARTLERAYRAAWERSLAGGGREPLVLT